MTIDRTNAACGALFIFLGLLFGYQSLNLELGSAFRMGPGYFPVVLSGMLVVLGIVILMSAFRSEDEPIGPIAWRGMVFILAAPIFFGLVLRPLGFVPSIFLTAFIACFASRRMKPLMAIVIAAVLTAFTTLVFVKGLELPFRLFGPWLGG